MRWITNGHRYFIAPPIRSWSLFPHPWNPGWSCYDRKNVTEEHWGSSEPRLQENLHLLLSSLGSWRPSTIQWRKTRWRDSAVSAEPTPVRGMQLHEWASERLAEPPRQSSELWKRLSHCKPLFWGWFVIQQWIIETKGLRDYWLGGRKIHNKSRFQGWATSSYSASEIKGRANSGTRGFWSGGCNRWIRFWTYWVQDIPNADFMWALFLRRWSSRIGSWYRFRSCQRKK